jgi:hypothetical protein
MGRSNQQTSGHPAVGLSLNCDGLTLEYFPGQGAALEVQVLVAVGMGEKSTHRPPPPYLEINLSRAAFNQRIAAQLDMRSLPATQIAIDDPSLLHLIQLLEAEMQTPQALNQMFVWSIVTILMLQFINRSLPGIPCD